jgi:hypothetical protein
MRRVNTGGRRNEVPLTCEQKEHAKVYAVSLGVLAEDVYFADNSYTSYWPVSDIVVIGTDVLPLGERVRDPNSNISLKGAIAHEIVGHREASLKGWVQPDGLLEDVQASVRAARFALGLSDLERCDLLRDAVKRLHKRGTRWRSVKHNLHIDRR